MSFGFGLGSGLKALTAARLGLQTSGNNIANANTPGYSRQRVMSVADLPFSVAGNLQMGTGVRVTDISRLVDDGIERRIRLQLGLFGEAEVEHGRFKELEGIFNEPNAGLSKDLGSLFESVSSLRSDPSDKALRGGLVQSGRVLADSFNLLSNRINELGSSTFNEVSGLVRKVNEHAAAIADLNTQIVTIEANGSTANDLRDTREQHIKEVSKMLDTRALPRSTGAVDVLVGGNLLVAGERSSELAASRDASGDTQVTIGRSRSPVAVSGGRIAALMEQESGRLPQYLQRLDDLAQQMILEFNRIHTTGLPRSGPFDSLRSHYGGTDGDGDGTIGDELLSQSDLPFPIEKGELYVNVSNDTSEDMVRHRIAIDPSVMTLQDLADELSAIDNLTASIDPTGRLRVNAASGYGFDFSPRLDQSPDSFGSFGGQNPSIGASTAGPFDLSGQPFPASFTVTTGTASSPVNTTVTIESSDFVNPATATVDELVSAINDDLGGEATAANIGGRLVIRSDSGGGDAQISAADATGSVLSAVGMPTGTVSGQDHGVTVEVDGTYTGAENGQFVFVPSTDGTIGVTDGLEVDVFDGNGTLVNTIDIGKGYSPGEYIEVGDGVSVKFGPGEVSASSGDVFALDTLADSDTSDVLVSLGMNSFFHGTSASDIEINPDLDANPDLLAGALSTASGDASNLARLAELRDSSNATLSSGTFESYYSDIVGDLGFEAAAAESTLQSQDALLTHLKDQRDSISGVNLDEEMVDMMRYQQSYEAAARYISTVQNLTTTLINIGR